MASRLKNRAQQVAEAYAAAEHVRAEVSSVVNLTGVGCYGRHTDSMQSLVIGRMNW